MEKILTVKAFDVDDETLGTTIAENLETFEEAETYIIAHDKKARADWQLSPLRDPEHAKEFEHHRYMIFHAVGKVALDDVLTKMSFEELCDEAFGWCVISVVEFKF